MADYLGSWYVNGNNWYWTQEYPTIAKTKSEWDE